MSNRISNRSRRWHPAVPAAADAVVMPAVLGRRVAHALRVARFDCGVLTDTDGRTWTFLTTRIDATRPELLKHLDHIGLWVVRAGVPLRPPAQLHTSDTWWWISAARPGTLPPPWQAVVATAWREAGDAAAQPSAA